MVEDAALSAADNDADPRRARSRNRLLDAAATLLSTGGVEAVTVEAVTKASKVARTTLYRHFSSSSHLLAATFERLLPQVTPPAPTNRALREQLIELLTRQARLFNEAPLHVTTLAWLVLGPTNVKGETDGQQATGALRARLIDHYRQPFDALLRSPAAQGQLRDFDLNLVLCQIIGPLAFAKITGFRVINEDDCTRIVDDFLTVHQQKITPPVMADKTDTRPK
ncbi:TetR/AcrR family transcriptional regulator [Mycolicibacterium holsaticum]|uniref:TetR family transcriptional regulator n=1 Tax=Mycolicibacterium holsaticum TaxID=152142 RepID=A0A1E3RIK1_9MYCO|nr:TetR/AcrR family transcriptional regulator [Mycolicibacterium holsaticum]ODQ89688.1 TetR family transcriptional regulator [Mycolicibacterium holsaticum]